MPEQVTINNFRPPGQIARLLKTLLEYAGISLYGRVEFPNGFCVGEGANMVHVTPDTMRKLVALTEKQPVKNKVDNNSLL